MTSNCSDNTTPLTGGYAPPGGREQLLLKCQDASLAFTGFDVLILAVIGLILMGLGIALYKKWS